MKVSSTPKSRPSKYHQRYRLFGLPDRPPSASPNVISPSASILGESPMLLRVVRCLPSSVGQSSRDEAQRAGVGQASMEETAGCTEAARTTWPSLFSSHGKNASAFRRQRQPRTDHRLLVWFVSPLRLRVGGPDTPFIAEVLQDEQRGKRRR